MLSFFKGMKVVVVLKRDIDKIPEEFSVLRSTRFLKAKNGVIRYEK